MRQVYVTKTGINKIGGCAMTLVRSHEKRNIKFNIADFNRIFDSFKKRRQNDVIVEPSVVRPAGIAHFATKRMLECV